MVTLGPDRCGWRATRAFLRTRRGMGATRWSPVRLQWRLGARQPAPPAPVRPRRHDVAALSWLTRVTVHLHHPGTVAHWVPLRSRDVQFVTRTTRSGPPAAPRALARPVKDVPPQPAARPASARAAASSVPAAGPQPAALAGRTAPVSDLRLAPQRARPLVGHRSPGPLPAPARAPVSVVTRAAALPLAWKPGATAAGPYRALARVATREAAPLPAAVPWQRQSVPLVWRDPSAQQAAGAGQPFRADVQAIPATASAAPAQPVAARSAPAAPAPGAIAAQLRASQLDPVLADRLATEVIRRVERSMRIERERRGH